MENPPPTWHTVYFSNGTEVNVDADSLEEAERNAHGLTWA
jgi:hypothetical protein